MYIPEPFHVDDLETLHDFMERHRFATLVTNVDGVPFATHLPLILDRARSRFGTLVGHVAKENPHWEALEADGESLAIFHGPHAYISPAWYNGNAAAVPTWNYAVVHAYGTSLPLTDPQQLNALLERMVEVHESGFDQPWRNDLPVELREQLTRRIVGFELELTRLEGKFKLGQNRSEEDQRGVLRGLRRSGSADLADFITAHTSLNDPAS